VVDFPASSEYQSFQPERPSALQAITWLWSSLRSHHHQHSS